MQNRTKLQLIITLSVCLLGAVATSWQIKRGLTRLSLLKHDAIEKNIDDEIASNDHLNTLSLSGHFLPSKTFIQPRSNQNHQPGWQVWVPFVTEKNTTLVSLGFQTHIQIPATNIIHGTIYYINAPPIRLGSPQVSHTFPQIVAQLDLERFSQAIASPLSPYVLVIDQANDQTLATPSLDGVLKHFSYAGQFFIITCIMCYYTLRQKNISNDSNI